MTTVIPWDELEQWSPRLFMLAAVFLFVGAANNGLAFLVDAYGFDQWRALILELGRLAALLGTAGLSVQVMNRSPHLGALCRGTATLAVIFVTALVALATLTAAGVLADPVAFIGLGAYVLSVSAFLVAGIGELRTGAHSRRVGVLLLTNVVALLVVFFGRLFVPLGLVATVVPAIQVPIYVSVGYYTRVWRATTGQTVPAVDATP